MNSPAHDWSFLIGGIYGAWKKHERYFTGSACDGPCGGWDRIITFRCSISSTEATCSNALGDGIRYRPQATVPAVARIVFVRNVTQIWTIDPSGSGAKRLTTGVDDGPAWSHDHHWIAYRHSCDCHSHGDSDIWIMRSDGSDRLQITKSYPGQAFFPTWSPDGTRIAFVSVSPGAPGAARITVTQRDGSGAIAVTAGPDDNEPSWSPKGDEIAFIRSISRAPNLVVVNAKTKHERVVLGARGTACADSTSSWSPDGRRIAVECQAHQAIWIIDATGAHLQRLVTGSHPAWSPDGQWIAFVGAEGGIWKIHPDGTGLTRLTSARQDSEPSW